MDRFYPYPTDYQRPSKKQKRIPSSRSALSPMPSLFANSNPTTRFLNVPSFASHKARVEPVSQAQDDFEEFLSSDLELSFASTMSLNSSPRDSHALTPESPVPMDISPAVQSRVSSKPVEAVVGRPRAFTSSARLFGRDVSNDAVPSSTPSLISSNNSETTEKGSTQGKKLQRAVLPFEWMALEHTDRSTERNENMFAPDTSDAMDIDTSFSQESPIPSRDFTSPVPATAVPTIANFKALFYESQSPVRPAPSPSAPQLGKRRSLSPEAICRIQPDTSSSPLPPSPSESKFERIASGPLPGVRASKPMLEGLGFANSSKRVRRPVLSTMAYPQAHSAYSAPTNTGQQEPQAMPLPRRAFSAMLPSNALNVADATVDENSSFEGPDMSSPAQTYAKRQQTKTLRRCDGSDNLRPTSHGTPAKPDSPGQAFNENSPSARWLMPGFGDNEAHGKILPCHRVKEDGLMRVTSKTVDDLLDGVYVDKLSAFYIIDCRFDYEYNGGHIRGALNMNTTSAVEEFLLGPNALKPKPSTSGDANLKTVLIFHCEFSAKRAPTFAKHLRSKDRAMNNHFYPKVHFPEVYILDGGYCSYFKNSAQRCQPAGGYIRMDDPNHAMSRREDLDQFRKAKFGRTKSYAYGDIVSGGIKMLASQKQNKRNPAPSNGQSHPLFAAANAARTRRGGLTSLAEDGSGTGHSDDEDTDIGDSPCPPPSKGTGVSFKGKKIGRAPLTRAETYGPIRMAH